jgi:DNA-binding transcriptional LysR family regulator
MARNLDVALLRTFTTAAERESMTATANVLHLTQSAVSQQIARLEGLLGGALFFREKQGLRLTSSGERLIGKARQLLSLNDEILADLAERAMEGKVRLGVPYDLAGAFVAPLLKAYSETHPKVEVSLLCSSSPELANALENGGIDLAIIEEPVGFSRGECLAVEKLVWVGAKGGAAHLKTPLPVSMVAETCAFRPAVLAALRGGQREWRTLFENGSIDATTAMVRSDLAVTAWLAFTVPADLDILAEDTGMPALPRFAINLHLPEHDAPAAVSELARYIRGRFLRNRQAA